MAAVGRGDCVTDIWNWINQNSGGVQAVGSVLYTEYVVPVELTGLILLAAIVGAVVLAKRRID